MTAPLQGMQLGPGILADIGLDSLEKGGQLGKVIRFAVSYCAASLQGLKALTDPEPGDRRKEKLLPTGR